MSILVLGRIRMLFHELWSLHAPVWTSCVKYWGLLWITLCTKIHLLSWRCSFSIGEDCMFVYRLKFFDMYITAAIPNVRGITNSGHNVHVKNCITSFTVTKVSEAREQIHIFSNIVSNTVNMSLPFKLVIKNKTKVVMFWNLLYYPWIQHETKRRYTTLTLLMHGYYHTFSLSGLSRETDFRTSDCLLYFGRRPIYKPQTRWAHQLNYTYIQTTKQTDRWNKTTTKVDKTVTLK